jgi:hypothetical protein
MPTKLKNLMGKERHHVPSRIHRSRAKQRGEVGKTAREEAVKIEAEFQSRGIPVPEPEKPRRKRKEEGERVR